MNTRTKASWYVNMLLLLLALGTHEQRCYIEWVLNSARLVVNCNLVQKQPQEEFYKKCVLENFSKFTGKHLPQPAILLKERLFHRCFTVHLKKFLKTLFYGTPPGNSSVSRKIQCSWYSISQNISFNLCFIFEKFLFHFN